jgi:hypothetical protein
MAEQGTHLINWQSKPLDKAITKAGYNLLVTVKIEQKRKAT